MNSKIKTFYNFISLLVIVLANQCFSEESIERKVYNSFETEIGYSQVVKAGNTIYISGITSNKTTLDDQVEDIYFRIQSILGDYDLDANAIVKQVIYVKNIDAFKNVGEARRKIFVGNNFPASTLVQIERLYSNENLVEIEVIAYEEQI